MVSLTVKSWLHGSDEIRLRLFSDKMIFEIFGNNSEVATKVIKFEFQNLHRLKLARFIIPENFTLLGFETRARINMQKNIISFRFVFKMFFDSVIQRS